MDIRPIDANALKQHQKMLVEHMDGYDIAYNTVPMHKVDEVPTLSLNTLRDEIYQDAVEHGLWEIEDTVSFAMEHHGMKGEAAVRHVCAAMIMGELYELDNAIHDASFIEELADVVIMGFSVAGRLDIDIDAAIRRKMEINKGRSWKHEESDE